MMHRIRLSLPPVAFMSLLALAGCGDDPKPSAKATPSASSSADQTGLMDPNMADAMKGVRAASSASAAPSAAQDGPPPNGVFGPGGADKAHAPGAPPSIEIIDEGAEPKAMLRPPALTSKQQLRVVSSLTMPQGGLPPMLYTLSLSPKGGDEEGGEAAGGGAPAAATGPTPIVIAIESLQPIQQQGGGDQVQKLLDAAKGVTLEGQLLASGALSGLTVKTSSAEQMQVKQLVDTLADVVGLFFSPYPDKPMGKGAYWIASDRATVMGMNLVRYRVTKVEEMSADAVTYSVQLRQYLTDGNQLPPIQAPPGQQLIAAAFAGQGQGTFQRATTSLVPTEGQFKAPMALQIGLAQNPQQGQQVQLQLAAQLLAPAAKGGDAAPAPAAP